MSLSNKIKQHCPHCNHEQELIYHQSVNITLDPEMKNKVLAGKLNQNFCINCNKEINIVSGFLYHDMKNQIMLELAVKTEEEDKEESKKAVIQDLISKGYIYRVVDEYERLVEKIHIFDNKLNDIVVQKIADKMKNMLDESIKQVKETSADFNFNVFFHKLEKGLFKHQIYFYCYDHPSQVFEMKFNLKNLEEEEKNNLYNLDILRK